MHALTPEILATCSASRLFLVALASRLVVFISMTICDTLIPDYDQCSLLYGLGPSGEKFTSKWFPFIGHWDGVHYVHIARYGYTHENLCAFFPVIPWFISFFASLGAGLLGVAIFNMVCFSFSACVLRALTWKWAAELSFPVNHDEDGCSNKRRQKVVGLAVLLFLFTPAAAFTVVAYTESLFSLISFVGMLVLAHARNQPRCSLAGLALETASALFFTLATLTRSNGILLCAFLLYPCAVDIGLFPQIGLLSSNRWRPEVRIKSVTLSTVVMWLYRVLLSVGVVWPYIAMSQSGFTTFCTLAGDPDKTCPATWTGFYAMVQKKYWGVGWFSYYTVNNIPNFVIAAPMYFATSWALKRVFSFRVILASPQILYFLGMLFIALMRMHVQVVTRFVMSCPALYWIVASGIWHSVSDGAAAGPPTVFGYKLPTFERFIATYFVTWAALSILLFSNHYPWT